MNRKEWMRSEIAAWRSEGVIGDEVAAQLLGRYAETGTRISWGALLRRRLNRRGTGSG